MLKMSEIVVKHPSCELCNKQKPGNLSMFRSTTPYGTSDDLSVHYGKRTLISCSLCKCKFSTHSTLREHLMTEHNLDLFKETKKFSTLEDFGVWKQRKENKFQCKYRMHEHVHNRKVNHWSYVCTESNSDMPQNRKRQVDADKPAELFYCASTIILVHDLKNHLYEATLFTPHTHDPLFFVFLSAEENTIKCLPTGKVALDSMFDAIRDNLYGRKERIHLPNTEEVKKMQRRFSVQSKLYFDDNPRVSIDLWANNMATLEDQSPVVYYKPQGLLDENTDVLLADDFVMILMTPFQSEILVEFGSNIVCIDCIRGTSAFEYSLTTFVVVTDKAEVLPVSYLISSSLDLRILAHYFSILCSQSGDIQPKILMTNDHPVFFQAWTSVYSEPDKQFLTPWHVDQNWRKQLQKVNESPQEKAQVYKAVRILMELTDEKMFCGLLNSVTREFLDKPYMKVFSDYFNMYYTLRKQQWAFCYRKEISFNTNMHLEAFQKFIKHIYIESRKVNRVDGLVDALMKLTKDRLASRFKELYKAKLLSDNYDNHYRSKVIRKGDTYQVYNDVWLVHSVSRNLDYVVHKEDECNQRNCELKCMRCNACVHTYSCNCPYYYLNFSICKHIHAICNIGSTNTAIGFANINNLLTYTLKNEDGTIDINQPSTSAATNGQNVQYVLKNNTLNIDDDTVVANSDIFQNQVCLQPNLEQVTTQQTNNGNLLIISNNSLNDLVIDNAFKLSDDSKILSDQITSNIPINNNNEILSQEDTQDSQSTPRIIPETVYSASNDSTLIEIPASEHYEVAEAISENVICNESSVEENHFVLKHEDEEETFLTEDYYLTEETVDENDETATSEGYIVTEEIPNGEETQYYNPVELKERIQQKIEFIRECLTKNTYDYRILLKVENELDRVLKLYGSVNNSD